MDITETETTESTQHKSVTQVTEDLLQMYLKHESSAIEIL